MRLLLIHPGVACLPCSECKKRLYDLETGEPVTYRSGPNKEERYHDGPEHVPPCQQGVECPKVSPERESEFILSETNQSVYTLWRRKKQGLRVEVSELLADSLAIIDEEYESAKKHYALERMILAAKLRKANSDG